MGRRFERMILSPKVRYTADLRAENRADQEFPMFTTSCTGVLLNAFKDMGFTFIYSTYYGNEGASSLESF
jgi:hypothetical protein